MKSLRDAIRNTRGTRRKVLVDVDAPEAGEAVLNELRQTGMEVRRVVGNKVFGEIEASALPALRRCIGVRAVEESVPLSPTDA